MRIFEKYRIRRGKSREAWNESICSFILTWFSDLLGNIGVGVIRLNQSERFSSVQFLSHVRLFVTPWTAAHQASLSSSAPRVHPNPCPLSWWCHPTISSSVVPFSSCPQSFPTSVSFPMNQLFASGGQSIGVSASASVLPMNIQDWFPLGYPCSPRESQEFSPTPQFKSINFSVLSFLYSPTLTSIHDK